MEALTNIEFFKTPDGEVMYKRQGEGVRQLDEHDRETVASLLSLIRTRYPEAFNAVSDIYSRSERNRPWYEFRMVSRFIRCNLGDYDTQTIDIDAEVFIGHSIIAHGALRVFHDICAFNDIDVRAVRSAVFKTVVKQIRITVGCGQDAAQSYGIH